MKVIDDAYLVRSKFAHGDQLSYKEKKKLESEYNGIRNLMMSVMEYLRISIVLMIMMRIEKDEFIDIIDDSLVDDKQMQRLVGLISSTKHVLGQSE